MTFKGEKIIGEPTLVLIELYIAEKGLFCSPDECYDYWKGKNWLTKKGVEPKSLESAINVYNGIAVQRFLKKNTKKLSILKLSRKDKKKDNNTKKQKENVSYSEQLRDKRWKAFRTFVMAVRGNSCEQCGTETNLQVHHPRYKFGCKALEYTCNEVVVLCESCHRKVHGFIF